ncbi:MAG: hypothetical protein K2X87_14850, partial [Gemmataceae bacterium]|nr:hypothetical protein [Gemmataceae bacterium]
MLTALPRPARRRTPTPTRAVLGAETLEGRDLMTATVDPGVSAWAGLLAAEATAPSPTGRDPVLGWTPHQQAVWDRMRADDHPWYRLAISNADKTGTSAERYADIGNWATLAFQMTGDRTYADKAWAKIRPTITAEPQNANQVRQQFMQYAQFYDWLSPALTAGQRAEYAAGLNRWAEWSLGIGTRPYVGGFRLTDSDQTIGQYFGLAFTDLALGTDWLGRSAGTLPVGGLTATGADLSTARNAIDYYARMAAGGEFIESTDYNLGTLQLLLLGTRGVRTATGADHFPEVSRLVPQLALAQVYALTPDLESAYKWGDTEHPGDLLLNRRAALLGTLAVMTRDDPAVGPYVQQTFNAILAKYGETGYGASAPLDTIGLAVVDPYAAAADPAALPAGYNAPGQGVTYFQDRQAPGGGLFAAHLPGRSAVDHEVSGFGDFGVYRGGEWAVSHPSGYAGPAVSGEAMNSLLVAGLSSARARGQVAAEADPAGGYAYAAGTTGGAYYPAGYYQPPPDFLREWTRSLFYLPSADGTSATVVNFDRVDASDPQSLPRYDRYRAADRAKIEAAPALAQWIIHAPVAPTVAPGRLSWSTAGGQQVRVDSLTAAPLTTAVVREADLWAGYTSNFQPDQLTGYQARVSVTSDAPWQTLLNVVQVSDPGTEVRSTRVASGGGEAEGALVQRPGQPDALVLFGARRGTRVVSDGYALSWAGGAGRTDGYLLDLDPSRAWTVTVDGGAAAPLTVSSQGVGRFSLTGTGSHTVWVTASGAAPAP